MKQAEVYVGKSLTGVLTEDDLGYELRYDTDYLKSDKAEAVSMTIPLTEDCPTVADSICRW